MVASDVNSGTSTTPRNETSKCDEDIRWLGYLATEIASQFSNRVVLDPRKVNIVDAKAWCLGNVSSRYQYDLVAFYSKPEERYMRLFSFAKKEDAMAFKLTFV